LNTFQSGLDGVIFQSHGSKLLGGLYRGAGQGPRPTAILLHGVPGVEKNLDFAYALRDIGWNCLYFHYRGSWGSEGAYSFSGQYDDLLAATEWLTQRPCVDADRLALIGQSAGGYLSLMSGAKNQSYRAIVAICPMISPIRAPFSLELFDELAGMLSNITGEELQSQWDTLPPVESQAEQLLNRPVLLLTGGQDDIFPPDHYPPLLEAVPTIEWHEYSNGDHTLSLNRKEAVQYTVDWLVKHIGQ